MACELNSIELVNYKKDQTKTRFDMNGSGHVEKFYLNKKFSFVGQNSIAFTMFTVEKVEEQNLP